MPDDLNGRTIGDFHLQHKLGEGGMGQVYLARQLSLKREVALKILRDDVADSPTALKRFQAEAEAVARISHPNIVQVYATGEQDGIRYMALELVRGRNLRDFLDRKGPPELPVALTILRQVAAALQRAGEVGLVHRDVKPENILLTRKAEVKVTDFGLSRSVAAEGKPLSLTRSGMTLGTPLYMSPEQVQGQPADHRSDLYSFGVTAYHLLAGHPPFGGATAFEVAIKHVQDDPPQLAGIRPDLPPDLCGLVHKLMAKKPEDRYQGARDVLRDLGKIQKGLAVGLPTQLAVSGVLPVSAVPGGPVVLNVTLTGSTLGGVTFGQTTVTLPQLTAAHPPPPEPSRWPWRLLGVVGVLLAVGIGWGAYRLTHPPVAEVVPPTPVGLPDAPSPVPVVTVREKEVREKLKELKAKDRDPAAARDQLRTGAELGLLLLGERRWDDADAAFKDVETSARLVGAPFVIPGMPAAVSRFGQAMVLAHQDKPVESDKKFEEAVNALPRQDKLREPVIHRLFFEFPEFGRAVSEAVSRNADNLAATGQKLPPGVEWLRTPAGMLKGPK